MQYLCNSFKEITMFKKFIFYTLLIGFISCQSNAQKNSEKATVYTVKKTDQQWKSLLTGEQYDILRKAGTERPFTSPLNNEKRKGTLICAACNAPLYKNENKFDSGTGWPSYDQAIKGQVERDVDYKVGYARTELKCATCGGHLGHEFNDGPRATTGKRHCINGVALEFVPEGKPLPAVIK